MHPELALEKLCALNQVELIRLHVFCYICRLVMSHSDIGEAVTLYIASDSLEIEDLKQTGNQFILSFNPLESNELTFANAIMPSNPKVIKVLSSINDVQLIDQEFIKSIQPNKVAFDSIPWAYSDPLTVLRLHSILNGEYEVLYG